MSESLTIDELQKILNPQTQAQGDEILGWTMQVLQAKAAMDQAVLNFHAVSDKEIALKASYKALGLDPRDAPVFGWNMSERPKQVITQLINNPKPSQVTASEQQPDQPISPPSGGEKAPNNLNKLLGSVLIATSAAGLTYFGNNYYQKINQNNSAALPEASCEELELDPAFRTEIKNDLQAIADKIKKHRDERLGLQ